MQGKIRPDTGEIRFASKQNIDKNQTIEEIGDSGFTESIFSKFLSHNVESLLKIISILKGLEYKKAQP